MERKIKSGTVEKKHEKLEKEHELDQEGSFIDEVERILQEPSKIEKRERKQDEPMEEMAEETAERKEPAFEEEKLPETLKQERDVVIPGDSIVDSMEYLPGRNTFREGNAILARRVGLVHFKGRVIEVIPLTGRYMPEPGDMVIGEVVDVQHAGWILDINAPYEGFLPLSGVREYIDPAKTNMSRIFAPGDVLYAKVSQVSPSKNVHITMQDPKARKFDNGRIVLISSVKVPRLIGKQGSMISLIKERTGCRISVGQNGLVWLQGENENLAVEAINIVEERSHTSGLTDFVSELLAKASPLRAETAETGQERPEHERHEHERTEHEKHHENADVKKVITHEKS